MSLAVKIPANFELDVNAKSERHALEVALEKWNARDNAMDITEPEWEEAELDIKKSRKVDNVDNGIWIEKIS